MYSEMESVLGGKVRDFAKHPVDKEGEKETEKEREMEKGA